MNGVFGFTTKSFNMCRSELLLSKFNMCFEKEKKKKMNIARPALLTRWTETAFKITFTLSNLLQIKTIQLTDMMNDFLLHFTFLFHVVLACIC